ncbi:putative transcription elongation factor SPT5-like 1, partial [Cucurbita argyrosperma subsp. argyrosperma]
MIDVKSSDFAEPGRAGRKGTLQLGERVHSTSQEALLHELTKLQLLVLVGPTLLVAVTVMPVPLGIVVQPMVANAPSPYLPSTPGGQPMTPNSASYLPGTPGGQPMTPGTGGLDMMSPVIGGDADGPWYMPDILVNVRRGDELIMGVIREVLPDGSCRVGLGSSGNGETITAISSDIEAIVPRKSDKIKIMGGALRGATGKLIGVDGTDGIVKVDDTLDVKILDLVILAKLAQP